MTDLTSAQLPPRDISPPNTVKRLLLILVPIGVLAMVFVLSLNHGSGGIVGGLIGLGLCAVIWGIEMPLILRAQRRRQAKMLSQLGPGTFFAGTATLRPSVGRQGLPAAGRLVLSETGAWFEPKRSSGQGLSIPWSEVGQIRLGPMPGKIGVGRLVLQLRTGEIRVFGVGNYATMAKTLAEHP